MAHVAPILLLLAIGSCSAFEPGSAPDVVYPEADLPPRSAAPEIRLSDRFAARRQGNVFITLTGPVTPGALLVLSRLGVEPPPGSASIVVYRELLPNVLAGHISASALAPVSRGAFVLRIESSDLGGLIHLQRVQ